MEPLSAPIQPHRGYRNTDSYGSGAFLASRDDGVRPHLGVDLICIPGDSVRSPIAGKVEHIGLCYPGDTYLKLVVIDGRGKHAGLRTRLLYVEPDIAVGDLVAAGDIIGLAQDIGRRDKDITRHVHWEMWTAVNPADLLPHDIPRGVQT